MKLFWESSFTIPFLVKTPMKNLITYLFIRGFFTDREEGLRKFFTISNTNPIAEKGIIE